MDKEIIQLIQMACKEPADIARALDLTKLIHNTPSIDAAIKIAEFYHLASLKEKMQIIKTDREKREDRLVIARNKRRRWLKPEPLPREIQSMNARPSRMDPLAEPYPLPNVERPGMARVMVPVIESSQYTKNDIASNSGSRTPREASLAPDPDPFPDGKRKRVIEEESQEDGFVMPPPKQSASCPIKLCLCSESCSKETNPFAKRPGQDTTRNPFGRKVDGNKVISKSESFFEKVDAASTDMGKPKRMSLTKNKKEGRQTTLLGMVKKNHQAEPVSQSSELDQPDSQATDVDISDGLVSDMLTDLSSQSVSIDWEESQGTDTQLTDVSIS